MKTLLLMRHAKSSWAEGDLPDHDRPLNERGKSAAPRMGRLLVEQKLRPDCVLASSAVRAQQTARALADAGAFAVPIEMRRELYLAAPAAYVHALEGLDSSVMSVLMVGHNPGLEELVAALSGRHEPMPTGALAVLGLPILDWSELRSVSARSNAPIRVWRPKELD